MEWSHFINKIWLNREVWQWKCLNFDLFKYTPITCPLHAAHIGAHLPAEEDPLFQSLGSCGRHPYCNQVNSNLSKLAFLSHMKQGCHYASFHCKWYFVLFCDYSAYQKGRICPSLSIFLICIRSAMVSRWSFEADMWSTVSGKVALNVTRMK